MIVIMYMLIYFFFFSSRRRHTRYWRDWSSDVCSSDLDRVRVELPDHAVPVHCDAGRATQVAANLIGNALKYSPDTEQVCRSEERRVGKECRSRWSPYH